MAEPSQKLRAVFGRLKSAVGAMVLFSLAMNLLMLAGPLYMMQVYDRVLGSGSVETLIVLSIIVMAAYGALGLVDGVRLFIGQRVGDWVDRALTRDIVDASVASAKGGGVATAQGLRDLSTVKGLLASPSIMPLFDIPFAPLFLIVLWILHPLLALVAIFGMVAMVLLGALNDRISRKASEESAGKSTAAHTFADLAIRDADSIAAMGMNAAVADKVEGRLESARESGLTASDRNNSLSAVAKGFRMALQSVMLGVGAWLVLQNQLTAGAIIAATTIMARAIAPTEQAIGTWKSLVSAKSAFGRLQALFDQGDSVEEVTSLPVPRGDLIVDKLVFQPKGAPDPVLRGLGFELKAGESLGLIGPSGSGKSTLLKMITRAQLPTRGTIRVDNAELHQWSDAERGQWLGYLAQDVIMLPGTVKENIARFRNADDTEVFTAAERAGVDELIRTLPKGYDTLVGPGGHPISGGQRQRIGLARALFGNPRIILLDEPTANLDSIGEAAVMKSLQRLKEEGRTVIVVAHRPSLVRNVDKILIMKSGKVEDFGDREAVLGRQSDRIKPVSAGPTRTVVNPTAQTLVAGGGHGSD